MKALTRAGTLLAVVAFVSLPPSPSAADPAKVGAITVRVAGLRSNDGQVGCSLHNSAKAFPRDATAAVEVRFCPISEGTSVCAFQPVPAGTYAVA